MIPGLKVRFLPTLREGHFIIHVAAKPVTSIPGSLVLGKEITGELLQIPAVRTVAQRVGRAESDDTFGPHESEFEVDLKPLKPADLQATVHSIRKILKSHSDIDVELNTFLTERIEETLSGYTAEIAAKIYGDDLDLMESKAQEISDLVKTVPGAVDVRLQAPAGVPQINIRPRRQALMDWGLAPDDVLTAVHVAFQAERSTQVYDGNRVFDVSVVLDPDKRGSVKEVAKLPIRTASGLYVMLGEVADVVEIPGRGEIIHEGARRVQVITLNTKEQDVVGFVENLRQRIAKDVKFPVGTYVEFSGSYEEQTNAQGDLLFHSLLSGVAIVLLLSLAFRARRNLVFVLTNLPLAMTGGVIAVYLGGGVLSVGSLVGFVTLAGITLRNSIMLLAHYEHLVFVDGLSWKKETAIRGASERLLPILMTATVTALGLAPLALSPNTPGHEIEGPMAQVILGGLFTAVLFNLLVLPTLSLKFWKTE